MLMRLFQPRYIRLLVLLLAVAGLLMSHGLFSRASIDFDRFHRQMESRFGAQRANVSRSWEAMLRQAAQAETERQKLEIVNQFVHQHIRYRTDQRLYGVEDYWASPLETLGHGMGDCEDYAILQYVSLRQAGISDDRLRLIYVNARMGGPRSSITQAHMVLGYYATPTSEPLILDSLIANIHPASQRPDLSPVFSFNSEGLWAGGATSPAASATARLSRWRNVLERIQQEGVSFQ
ncbi:MAG: transglutaminase-like cysteine peptidase [Nitrincola lacisaponensis]|uniref:T1SS associated transglutaminase-like cysteine proteinase LapP n=1 Tax=Nitrincola lacisaponensis TaxID=267850 RepID=A0A063XYH8_9GAMM|nr:transglutaminase-like cysteine peptidase [Nitrincola lacisaponensis]KDE39213.1 T1SS associated transglutaminase-like cysteine proteinase LapP [Nitrincola lacisaponensis]